MLAELAQACLEAWRLGRYLFEDAIAGIDFQRLQRHRRGYWMPAISKAVAESPQLAALIHQRGIHLFRHRDRSDRQIGRRQRLGERHCVGLESERLHPEWRTQPAEAANHLI